MFFDQNSQDKVRNAFGEWVTEQTMVLGWVNNASLPDRKNMFESMLPSEADLNLKGEEAVTWFTRAARDILQNQQAQMMNMSTALNQSFYNKVVSSGSAVMAGLGTLDKFVPEIGNMVAGKISGRQMEIGGDIFNGVGAFIEAGEEGLDGAASAVLDKVSGVLTSAIGGLSAIVAVNPIVGAVAAAGFMIGKAMAAESERRRVARVEKDNAFYSTLDPLPIFKKTGDEFAMNLVLEAMPKSDWTNLFLPRYNPNNDWVGRLCQTGVEFFPGTRDEGMGWGEGNPKDNFYRGTKGLGMLPGTQQITGTLQGRLGPGEIESAMRYMPKGEVDSLWEWAQMQAPKTVGRDAIDTGDYYPSSAQTLSFLWGHLQTQGASGNPDLYKIDCPYVDGQWGRYIDGAWDYLQEMCSWDSYSFDMKGHSMKKHIDKGWQSQARRKAMVAQHSCAIACLLGTYRCHSPELGGGPLTSSPGYRQGQGSQACNTGFNSFPSDCRQNIYDAYIHERVVELHQMQYDMLSASLVCAYVGSDFVAFNGNGNDGGQAAKMMQKLKAMRTELLVRPDQWKYLVEADVPRNEHHGGSNWYDQLKAAGAFQSSGQAGGAGSGYALGGLKLTAGQGFNNPAPAVMQLVGRIPGQELVEDEASGKGGGGKGVILMAAAALGLMAMARRR